MKGRAQYVLSSFDAGPLKFSHAIGGAKSVHRLKKVLPRLEEGGAPKKWLEQRFPDFEAPFPTIKDRPIRYRMIFKSQDYFWRCN